MTALGYQDCVEGICYGIAAMGLLAILARDVAHYNRRLRLLAGLSSSHLYQLFASGQLEWEILAYFDSIQIYQNMRSRQVSHLFPPDSKRLQQNLEQSSQLCLSTMLEQSGGIRQIASVNGLYTREQINQLLISFRRSARASQMKYPAAFILGNRTHAITIGYDRVFDTWHYAEAASGPSIGNLNEDILSQHLFDLLSHDNHCLINLKLYCRQSDHAAAVDAVRQWQLSTEYRNCHEITPKHITYTDKDGNSLLAVATIHNDVNLASELLERGDSANTKNNLGNTALTLACYLGRTDIAAKLLDRGALDISNNEGASPLSFAVDNHWPDIVRLLIQRQFDVNSRHPVNGSTVLHLACQKGFSDIADELLRHGADVNARNCQIPAPLIYAINSGHIGVVKVLLEHHADINPFPVTTSAFRTLTNVDSNAVKRRANDFLAGQPQEPFMITAEILAQILGHDEIANLLHQSRYKSGINCLPGNIAYSSKSVTP